MSRRVNDDSTPPKVAGSRPARRRPAIRRPPTGIEERLTHGLRGRTTGVVGRGANRRTGDGRTGGRAGGRKTRHSDHRSEGHRHVARARAAPPRVPGQPLMRRAATRAYLIFVPPPLLTHPQPHPHPTPLYRPRSRYVAGTGLANRIALTDLTFKIVSGYLQQFPGNSTRHNNPFSFQIEAAPAPACRLSSQTGDKKMINSIRWI